MQTTIVYRTALIGGCTLGLLLIAQLKMLAALDDALMLIVALDAFETEHNLFRRFRLFVENGFRLSTKPSLLHVVTSLSLGEQRVFALLVLGHFVQFMPFAFFAHAQRHTSFGNDNHCVVN